MDNSQGEFPWIAVILFGGMIVLSLMGCFVIEGVIGIIKGG